MYFSRKSIILTSTFIVFLFQPSFSSDFNNSLTNLKNIKPATPNDFEIAKATNNVTLAYFYQKDFNPLPRFLDMLDSKASFLRERRVNIIVIDCNRTSMPDYCKMKNQRILHTFQKGETLIDLQLEHLFDEDSLISNILQLVLVDDIPVLMNQQEVDELQYGIRGVENAVFGYFDAIGSPEHRAFIEIAYDHRESFRFSLSTDQNLAKTFGLEQNINIDSSLWLMKCKAMPPDQIDPCPHVRMYEPLTKMNILNFITSVDVAQNEAALSKDGKISRHMAYLFHEAGKKADVTEVLNALTLNFSPGIAIKTETMSASALNHMGFADSPLPTVAVELKNESMRLMKSDFNVAEAVEFVRTQLSGYLKQELTKPEKKNISDDHRGTAGYQDLVDKIEKVAKDDDEVSVQAALLRRTTIDISQLTEVTDDNFVELFEKKPTFMMLYHLKFDARSQLLLQAYVNVSVMTNGKSVMGHVDCHHWKTVCDDANILHYPQIAVHSHKHRVVYTESLESESLVNIVTMLKKETFLELSNVKVAKQFLSSSYPSAIDRFPANISVLGLAKTEEHAKEIRQLAHYLRGTAFVGLVKADVAKELSKTNGFGIPGCVLIRHNDPDVPHVVYKGSKFTHDYLHEFVLAHQYPMFAELTPVAYPTLMREAKPLVILFMNDQRQASSEWKTVAEVVASHDLSDVVFTWMDASDKDSRGGKLLRRYTFNTYMPLPKLALVSHKLSGVYLFPGSPFDKKSVVSWVRNVIKGMEKPSFKLIDKKWTPTHIGFDHLRMMDEGINLRDAMGDQGGIPDDDSNDNEEELADEENLDDSNDEIGQWPFNDESSDDGTPSKTDADMETKSPHKHDPEDL